MLALKMKIVYNNIVRLRERTDMEKFIIQTPQGRKVFTDMAKAEKYKAYCENRGWGLIAHGGNVWEGWLLVYGE